MPVTDGQRLLFLSPRVPHPLNNGAKIRTRALLTALAERHPVDYLGFLHDDLTEAEARRGLERCASVTLIPDRTWNLPAKLSLLARGAFHAWPATILKYWDERIAAHAREWFAKNPRGIAHADHIHMAPYLDLGRCRLRAIDEHNVEAQILERASEHYKPNGVLGSAVAPLVRHGLALQARRMRASEASMVGRSDVTLAVSDGDAGQLGKMAPGTRIEVIPNGVDVNYFAPPAANHPRKGRRMIFTGSMNWLPNEDAVVWFAESILPLLKTDKHDEPWRLDIVGQKPAPAVSALASERIRVTGTVDDVRPYTHDAEMFIVPLRIGGGSRLKILEAFAMGIPVVSTSVGCEGLGVTDGNQILIGDTPEAFARQIERLSANAELSRAILERARRHVLEHFTWSAIGRRMLDVYENHPKGG